MPRNIVLRRSKIHGNGVFAVRTLPKGKRVIRYGGKVLAQSVVDRRFGGDADTGHTFLFTLNDRYVIDGASGGNISRWINHSCEPNCETVWLEHEGGDKKKDRIYIETMRRIRPGEELTYDYGIVLEEPHTRRMKAIWACHCGAKRCTGTLLQPKPKKKKSA
ncbi:MAG TPA: SET domain-containing protein-lysine N-methyltransferase [Solimonas sp.]|nr:SET domain-containing protein-lysine N-methyltransferase [Solimonas sp.]